MPYKDRIKQNESCKQCMRKLRAKRKAEQNMKITHPGSTVQSNNLSVPIVETQKGVYQHDKNNPIK